VRTTLTLDDDVAKQLQREMRRSGASLKAAVNHYLRLGLTVPENRQQKPFTVQPRTLGLPPGLSYDNVEDLLEALDGPAHK
jgi:hypothetical protein